MRFNIYGRYDLEVARVDGAWAVHRVEGRGPAARRRRADLVIPAGLGETEVATYLDDLLHELARPGDEIRRLDWRRATADWTVRRAVAGDAVGLAECIDAAYRSYLARIDDLPDVTADVGGEIDRLQVWVAEAAGEIAGGLVLNAQGAFMLLANVVVHPDHQGAGLGRTLMVLAEQEAAAQGCREMRLNTHVEMTDNISLYEHFGWQETGRQGNKVAMRKVL